MAGVGHDRLAEALAVAHDAHGAQKRKGTDIPYLAHPLAVAALVLEFGGSEDQAVAALLHDVLEDGADRPGEAPWDQRIGAAFGPAVLAIVRACTDGTFEQKAAARTPEARYADWQQRKQRYLEHLRGVPAGDPALLVSACDKLHNARCIVSDLQGGYPVFERFTGRRNGTLWYYGELVDIFCAKGVAAAGALYRAVKRMDALAQPSQSRESLTIVESGQSFR